MEALSAEETATGNNHEHKKLTFVALATGARSGAAFACGTHFLNQMEKSIA